MGKDKFPISEQSMMRSEIEDLRRRLTRLEERLPSGFLLPEVSQMEGHLQIRFRRNMGPDKVYRFPAEEVRLYQEWRPAKPAILKAHGDCDHEGESQTTALIKTCLRCSQVWREEVKEND